MVADLDVAALCRDKPTEFDDDKLVGMVRRDFGYTLAPIGMHADALR